MEGFIKKISDVMCCIKLSKLYLKLTPPPNLGIMVKNAKFGFWNPPKKCSDFLILGRREGVKKDTKIS